MEENKNIELQHCFETTYKDHNGWMYMQTEVNGPFYLVEGAESLSLFNITNNGWKHVYNNDDSCCLFKFIGDDGLFMSWSPYHSEYHKGVSNVQIYRDCNKPNEHFKENIYVKFTGVLKTIRDYKTIVQYLNLKQ